MKVCYLYLVVIFGVPGCHRGLKQGPGAAGASMPGGPQVNAQQLSAPSVLVQGDVKNHVILWTEDLTVATAIAAAEYQSSFNPRLIILVRQGQSYQIPVRDLLSGRQNPLLEPGDLIDVKR
jgi:hypothetical protein